jgi:L-ascorbate metabolism protein UlaG (beta-lactamase superfamily)
MLKITYLSHSCFMLEDGKYKVIIDPFLTGNPTAPIKAKDVKTDFIVVTHAHGDHLGDAIPIAKANGATIIAVNELANWAAEQGVEAHNMHIGGGWNFPFGRLKFTIAHHGSGAPTDGRYLGNPAGVVIKIGGKTIYHAGDTALFLDMKLIGELDKLDVAMLPIGDNFTMGIDDAVRAVEFLNPGIAIPIHYNTFPAIKVDPQDFSRKLEMLGKSCKVMKPLDTLEFE